MSGSAFQVRLKLQLSVNALVRLFCPFWERERKWWQFISIASIFETSHRCSLLNSPLLIHRYIELDIELSAHCYAMLCYAMLSVPGTFSFPALLRKPLQCQKSPPDKGSTWAARPLFALSKKLRVFFFYEIQVTPVWDAWGCPLLGGSHLKLKVCSHLPPCWLFVCGEPRYQRGVVMYKAMLG